jgi:Domain of unknown function (DUF5664)
MSDEGVKHDQGKLPYHLLPFDAVDDVVGVLQYGANKYGERNWEKGMELERIEAAIGRHFSLHMQGELCDQESHLKHMAHIAANALFWLALHKRKTTTVINPVVEELRQYEMHPVEELRALDGVTVMTMSPRELEELRRWWQQG